MITKIQITPLSFPLTKPFSNHIRKITQIKGLEIRIITDSGIVGHGFIYGLSDMPHQEIIGIIECRILSQLLDHNKEIKNASQLMSYWQKIWPSLKASQYTQSELTALAIVDIAIWDIFMKDQKTSLHKFLGEAQEKIPAYLTTGWLSLSIDELVAECKECKDNEINAFKIRLGHKDDIARVKAVREAMGDEFILMLDANQRYNVDDAIQASKDFSPFNMLWLEEPTENNLDFFAQVKQQSVISIALGESIIDEADFINICRNKLTDILQPDLPRCGGITGYIRVIEIALKYDIPVCNHLLYELSVSLIAAYKNGYILECDDLLPSGIYSHSIKAKAGFMVPPKAFGNGVELTEAALQQYGLTSYLVRSKFLG